METDSKVNKPNRTTIAALLEADELLANPDVKRYYDVEAALAGIKK